MARLRSSREMRAWRCHDLNGSNEAMEVCISVEVLDAASVSYGTKVVCDCLELTVNSVTSPVKAFPSCGLNTLDGWESSNNSDFQRVRNRISEPQFV